MYRPPRRIRNKHTLKIIIIPKTNDRMPGKIIATLKTKTILKLAMRYNNPSIV